jgi:plasmid stabilization system protein ParE
VRVVFSRTAEANLRDIAFYIARDDFDGAMQFVERLREACHSLADFPSRFPIAEGLGSAGIRKRTYRDYVIHYRIEDAGVSILSIAHGSRLFPFS